MPGPSGLPNTLATDGAELLSAVKSSEPSQSSKDREASPASPSQAADVICGDGVNESQDQHGMQSPGASLHNPVLEQKSHVSTQHGTQLPAPLLQDPVNIEKPRVSSQPVLAEAAPQASEPVQPKVSKPEAQLALPQEEKQELRMQTSADDASAARPQLPSIPDGLQQPAGNDDQPQAPAPTDAVDDTSPVHEPEEMVLPDSVGPTQHGQQSVSRCQAAPTNPPSSPNHSQLTSASLEAAYVLAALASGEKRLTVGSTADRPELAARGHRQCQHKQCPSNRAPLQTIQRTADVQRQPLKPAWQHSGKAGTSWGAKSRRTRAQGKDLSRTGNISKTCGRAAKQGSGHAAAKSTQAHASPDALSSEHAGHELVPAAGKQTLASASSKQVEGTGAAADSIDDDTRALTNQPKLPGSKQSAPKQVGKLKAHEMSQPASLLHDSKTNAQDLQENVHCPSAAAAVADNDDDFKPNIRRRAKSHQSPKGSRQKAKLSLSDTPLSSPPEELGSATHAKPLGQVLLSWDAAHRHWDQHIITAFNASKVMFAITTCNCLQRQHAQD